MSDTSQGEFRSTFHLEDDGSLEELAAQLERLLEQAVRDAAPVMAKTLGTAFKNALGGRGGGDDPFQHATKSADEFHQQLKKSITLAEEMERRLLGMRDNAGSAFNTDALAVYDRNLLGITELVQRLGLEWRDMTEEQRRAAQVLAKGASSGIHAELGVVQAQNRALRTAANERLAAEQNATRIAIQESKERIVQAQLEGSRVVAETRTSGQRRVALIQAFSKQIQIAESAVAATFRATGTILSGAVSGIGRGLSGAAALFRRSGDEIGAEMRDTATDVSVASNRINQELSTGFASALNRRESVLRSSMTTQERILSQSVTRQTATINRLETTLSSGVLGAASGRSAAAGAVGFGGIGAIAGGAGLAGLLTAGFTRFSDLQRLNTQFEALLGSQEQAAALMEQIKGFAKITPFDLVGVADLAKGFIQIGTAAEDILPSVSTIADAVAMTGGSTDELTRIQRAIGQVVSAGRLQGDELNQLAENLPGLNIRQILADQLTGGDVQALVKMQEAGELSADAFVGALMTGLQSDPRIAGAAVALASTLKGRFDNLKEQFADFGAAIIGLVAEPLAQMFAVISTGLAGIAQFIRGEELTPFLEVVRTAAQGAAIALGGLLVAKAAGEAMQILAVGLKAVFTPLGVVVTVIGAIGAAIALLTDRSPAFALALKQTGAILKAAFTVVKDVVLGVFDTIGEATGVSIDSIGEFGDFLAEKLGVVNDILFRFVGQRLRPILEGVVGFVRETMIPAITAAVGFVLGWVTNTVFPALVTAFNFVKDTVLPALGSAAEAVVGWVSNTAVPGIVAAFNAVTAFARDTLFPIVAEVGAAIGEWATEVGPKLASFAEDVAGFVVQFDSLFATLGGGLAGFLIGGPVVAGIGAAIGLIATNFEQVVEIIEPATEAIEGFMDTMRDSGLGAAVSDVLGGIVGSFANLGGLIVGALDDAWDAVTDFFDSIEWIDLGKGALDIVEEVGRIIGSIATNPAVVRAVATVVAVIGGSAALVVLRFGEGLVRGIASNLDDWLQKGFEGLSDALRSAFRNLPQVLGVALAGLFAVQTLRTVFSDYGAKAGTGFMSGFRNAISGAGGTLSGFTTTSGGFFNTLFGSSASIQSNIQSSVAKATETTRTEIQRMRNVLGFVGRDPIRIPTPSIDPRMMASTRAQVQREYDKLATDIGPGGIAGIRLRQAVQGIGDAFRNFDTSGIRSSFGNLRSAFVEGGRVLVQEAGTIGRAVGGSLVAGLASFQIGKSAGAAGGVLNVLLGIGTGAAVGFSVGGGVGAAVGATASAIGAALGQIGAAAQKAEDEIKEYQDAIRGLSGQDLEEALDTAILENFRNETLEVRDALRDLGFRQSDLREAFLEGQQAVDEYAASLVDGFGPESREWARLLRDDVVQLDDDLGELQVAGIDLNKVADELGIGVGDLGDLIGFLRDESGETATALEDLRIETDVTSESWSGAQAAGAGFVDIISGAGSAAATAAPQIELGAGALERYSSMASLVGSSTPEVVEAVDETASRAEVLTRQVDLANEALDELFGKGTITTLQEGINDIIISLENIPSQLAELDLSVTLDRAKFENSVDDVVEQFGTTIREAIENEEITAVPQIITQRDVVLAELTAQLEKDGLTAAEAQFLMDVTIGINSIVNEEDLAELIAAARGDAIVRLPITVEPNVSLHSPTWDKALAKRNAEIRGELGNNAPQMGFAPTAGGNGGFSADDLGLPTQINIPIPVNVTPVVNLVGGTGSSAQEIGVTVMRSVAQGIAAAGGLLVSATAAAINAGLRTVAASYTTFLTGGTQIGRALAAGVETAAGQLVGSVANAINFALRTIAASYATFFNGGTQIGRALAAGTSTSAQPMVTSIAGAINFALRTIANSYQAFYSGGQNIARALAAGAQSGDKQSLAWGVYNAVNAALRVAGGSYTAWYQIGINMGRALASGLAATINIIAQSAAAVVRSAILAAQGTAKIKSPSLVFMEIGGFMGEGLALGLDASTAAVAASASAMADEAIRMASAVDSAIRVQPVTSGTVTGIREASGGTSNTVVNLNVGGNINGDKAMHDWLDDALNQFGQAVASRPRYARASG